LAKKINKRTRYELEELAEWYITTSPKWGGNIAWPGKTSTSPDSHSFPPGIRYRALMTEAELRESEARNNEARKRKPKPKTNVRCEGFHNSGWIDWVGYTDDLFPHLKRKRKLAVAVDPNAPRTAKLNTKRLSFVAAAHRRKDEILRTASERNIIAMMEGRKLSGIPRHKIFKEDDYSPYERLERQCKAIKEAKLQRGSWRKPMIRIHTYPKGMAFPMAAE
jgi:hypothetical protein